MIRPSLVVAAVLAIALPAAAGAPEPPDAALDRLAADAGGPLRVERHRATGMPRLLVLETGRLPLAAKSTSARAMEVFERYGAAFGLTTPAEQLVVVASRRDRLGAEHVTLEQRHRGLPVFAAVVRVHFDGDGRLAVVNGALVPDLELETSPEVSAAAAGAAASGLVAKHTGLAPDLLAVQEVELVVFRTGLVRGVPGEDRLAWRLEVGDGLVVRQLVLVDAVDGRVLDRIDLAHDLRRQVHERRFPNPIWTEGDALPYSGGDNVAMNTEVNELVDTSREVHELFANLSGGDWLSWNGADATMHNIWDAETIDCPNAVAYGTGTAYCRGVVTDDIVAHEWVHNYTGATHGLIYQWQPGALNEAYSDIFGETVDLLNGRGSDAPDAPRTAEACSALGGVPPAHFEVTAPAALAGSYAAGGAAFNPPPPWSAAGRLELVDDGLGAPNDACQPPVGFTAGRVALVDRGSCLFVEKGAAVQAAGAIAMVVVNNQGNDVLFMGGDGRLAIPSVLIGQGLGESLKAALAQGVQVTLSQAASSDGSLRWLIGEDSTSFGGAIRDMWTPGCFGDPGAVTDPQYFCGEGDNGGVHTNSGVPNRAYALVVDGGRVNGVDVTGIGLAKAAHIWWRAMSVYQVPTSDFADHADALELSCSDLVGAPLTDLVTGDPLATTLSTADCAQVAAALVAVEMRTEPEQCSFVPLLAPDPPEASGRVLFEETFSSHPGGAWTRSNEGVYPEYDPRDWEWTTAIPEGREGGAMFALDSLVIGDCRPGSDDQSGVMHLDSPLIEAPFGLAPPLVVFDHWIATEPGYDGGNLKVRTAGGSWRLVPAAAFRFNPYNGALVSRGQGNTNPMASEPAFTGADGGSLEGSWGQSQVDLRGLVRPGESFQLRFDLGVDGCNGLVGWYLDSVRVVAAEAAPRQGNVSRE